jgi:cephalosporin hydroxylase
MIEEFDKLYQKVYNEHSGTINPVYHGSQIKEEFILAWNELIPVIENTPGTFTFLEIGAYRGLWPLMLSFVCEALQKPFEYTTVTWIDQDPNNQGIFKVKQYYEDNQLQFNLKNRNSQLEETLNTLSSNYDVVFIDADHRYDGVLKDIKLYSPLATQLLMFHDIRPKAINSSCGVYQAIQDSGIVLDKEVVVDGGIMGIGLKYVQ